jgi:hypothetical protein
MVRVIPDGENYIFEIRSEPPLIYLDHWALRLFSSDATMRARFLEGFRSRGTLMFSLMNIAEIAANTLERTADELRAFLRDIGPHWVPSTIDPMHIIEVEQGVAADVHPCISEGFLREPKFARRLVAGDLTLASVVDLTRGEEGEENVQSTSEKAKELLVQLEKWRVLHAKDPKAVDRAYPRLPFDDKQPMQVIYNGLARSCITQQFNLNENHVRDLYHTACAVCCGDMVLLDAHWLELVRQLKLPPNFVLAYGRDDVEHFLDDLTSKFNSVREN